VKTTTLEILAHAVSRQGRVTIGDPGIIGNPNIIGDPNASVRIIVGGADGTLITIDGKGHIRVNHPEGPGPTEIREAFSAIMDAVGVIAKAAEVQLNRQPIPPGRRQL
jgi:hypothetical protein